MAEAASTTWSESKLAGLLGILAAIVAIAVVCRVALEEDLSWIAWTMFAVAFLLLATARWPYGALLALIGASVMPRFFVDFLGWHARPEHFAAGIIALAVGIWWLRSKQAYRFETLDYWVLGYVAINYISSAFGSSEPSATLRWALQNNLAVLPYFLIRFLVRDLKILGGTFRILLAVGMAESIYGVVCYTSHHLFGTTGGMEVGAYLVDVAAPYGSMFEPNLFGAYTASCAVTFLALYLREVQNRFGNLIGFLIASLATILSFSRAALFALVVAICCVFWSTRRLRHGNPIRLRVFALALVLTLLIATTGAGGVLQKRLSDLYYEGLTEGTAISRFIIIWEALQQVPQHPLLGSGTASFNLSFDWTQYIPEWASEKTWIGNVPVRVLHDTGVVGLAIFAGFLISLCVRIRRNLRGSHRQVPMLLALSVGALVYGISFQSSDGSILAFAWVHLGLLASAAILTSAPGHDSGGIQSPLAAASGSSSIAN
jgi:hypothetical protein